MAAAGSVSITGTVEDTPTGSKTIGPITITSAAAVGQQLDLVLQSGFNSIAVPALATSVIIVFDPTSAVTKTLKGVTGDTGILLKPAGANLLNLTAGGVATFGITASATDTGLYTSVLFV